MGSAGGSRNEEDQMTATTEYGSLREKIAAEKAEREERYRVFEAAHRKALEAARQAGLDAVPAPMVVTQHANQLDDTSPVTKSW